MSNKAQTNLGDLSIGHQFDRSAAARDYDRFAELDSAVDTLFAQGMAALQTGDPATKREGTRVVDHIVGFGRPG